ncbi:hypothetical protein [Kitasatospora sp. HPMI-4]|uniref:hypothetical protein n=1 Tax=Kitasatospora sp. HPMI-4 TaxID=3448443 RepID=UPI003F1E3B90
MPLTPRARRAKPHSPAGAGVTALGDRLRQRRRPGGRALRHLVLAEANGATAKKVKEVEISLPAPDKIAGCSDAFVSPYMDFSTGPYPSPTTTDRREPCS